MRYIGSVGIIIMFMYANYVNKFRCVYVYWKLILIQDTVNKWGFSSSYSILPTLKISSVRRVSSFLLQSNFNLFANNFLVHECFDASCRYTRCCYKNSSKTA